ncbi:AMP-binding protein, partial [Streptomyces sp. NPDC057540]|uniref:AMP-binding protein n=1 Tax=Streptomyces sp. NPDC057540 TaxID=3346160 RepID=UPI0036900BD9
MTPHRSTPPPAETPPAERPPAPLSAETPPAETPPADPPPSRTPHPEASPAPLPAPIESPVPRTPVPAGTGPLVLRDLLPASLRRSWAADGSCPDLDLYGLFRARRIADPHRTALLDARGALCYTALDGRARRLAAGLAGLGIGPGDVVGVQLPNHRDAVVADLALAALGAVALPFPVGRGVREAESRE